MLVKVQLLRHDGERLPAREVRSRPASVGWIRLYGGLGIQLDRAERVAVLQLPEGRLLELYDAQLIQWDGRGLILSGEERWPAAARALRTPPPGLVVQAHRRARCRRRRCRAARARDRGRRGERLDQQPR